MKQLIPALILLSLLVGCAGNSLGEREGGVVLPDHSHGAAQGENVVEHDPVGYCGNTVTTVRCEKLGKQPEQWERSVWGSPSVGLTDFLRWLDYSDDICRCLPEYYVKTEFSPSEYGINLTGGYVRVEGGQCQLTQEQLVWLNEILGEIKTGTGEDLCALPPEKIAVYDSLSVE